MLEKLAELDHVRFCLMCGEERTRLYPHGREFYLPRVLAEIPTLSPEIPNPFAPLIDRRKNIFKLCEEVCLASVTLAKRMALSNGRRNEYAPDKLLEYLAHDYPVTDQERYYPAQLTAMMEMCGAYFAVARGLTEEFNPELIERFKLSGVTAERHAIQLNGKIVEYKRTGYIES